MTNPILSVICDGRFSPCSMDVSMAIVLSCASVFSYLINVCHPVFFLTTDSIDSIFHQYSIVRKILIQSSYGYQINFCFHFFCYFVKFNIVCAFDLFLWTDSVKVAGRPFPGKKHRRTWKRNPWYQTILSLKRYFPRIPTACLLHHILCYASCCRLPSLSACCLIYTHQIVSFHSHQLSLARKLLFCSFGNGIMQNKWF